jgi:hypothetical protein
MGKTKETFRRYRTCNARTDGSRSLCTNRRQAQQLHQIKADKMPAGLKSKLKDLIEMVPASSTMRSGGQVNKVQKVMHEFKLGKLKSSSGQKVKSRKQAIAIALSEQRAVMKKKK